MTLLPSHIPVLYCMLYYRGARHNSSTSLQPPRHVFSLDISTQTGSSKSEEVTYGRRAFTERPWIYHNRKVELNKLCSGQVADQDLPKAHGEASERCALRNPEDVRRSLSERFLTEAELQVLTSQIEISATRDEHRSRIHYIARLVSRTKALEPLTAGDCVSCQTEIGYEVLTEVSNFKGVNYTVVNFNNGYQFIATGRCLNENASCRVGGQARCRQIYKAHWTLVWTADLGVQLVAHEVPSHCECLNLGSAFYPVSPLARNGNIDTPLDFVPKP